MREAKLWRALDGAQDRNSSSQPSIGWAEIVLWCSFAAGFLELGILLFRKLALGQILRVSRQAVWMTPAGELLLVLPLALGVLLLSFVMPRLRTPWSFMFVTLFVSLCSALLAVRIVHLYAAILLSAGVAWRLTVLAMRHAGPFRSLVRRTTPIMVGLLLVFAAGVNGSQVLAERILADKLPAARSRVPNVVLIIWDTVRSASLSLHGHMRSTSPELDRIATQGVVFEHAYSTAPWTLPAHVSLLTGQLPFQTTANWHSALDGQPTTLAEVLEGVGYRTAGFAANTLYTDWEHGLARGFQHYEDYRITVGQVFQSTAMGFRLIRGEHGWSTGIISRVTGSDGIPGRRTADHVNAGFLRWIDRTGGRPFFAFLNYFDAHLPYDPSPAFEARFGPVVRRSLVERLRRGISKKGHFVDITPAQLQAEVNAYEASIARLDHALGDLVAELERRGLLDNTLLIVTSDHGEEFGEHGDFEHGSNLYLPQLHVPLVIRFPARVPAGLRVSGPVSVRDVPATILQLIGSSDDKRLPGSSLARAWQTSAPRDSVPVYAELTPGDEAEQRMYALFDGNLHFIQNVDSTTELYDLEHDLAELRNLVQSAPWRDTASHFRDLLRAVLSGGMKRNGNAR